MAGWKIVVTIWQNASEHTIQQTFGELSLKDYYLTILHKIVNMRVNSMTKSEIPVRFQMAHLVPNGISLWFATDLYSNLALSLVCNCLWFSTSSLLTLNKHIEVKKRPIFIIIGWFFENNPKKVFKKLLSQQFIRSGAVLKVMPRGQKHQKFRPWFFVFGGQGGQGGGGNECV